VTDQGERYDRMASGYARWWAPVLAPAVVELLDEVERGVSGLTGRERLLDIGTGTGQLALGALTRWPASSAVGIDASGEMRAMAEAEADRVLPTELRDRFETAVAFADALPFADGAFDLAVSSFVVQLVPNRARVLREVRRVVRPGGVFAYVSWLQDDRVFVPDEIFDDVLDELEIDAWGGDGRSGDLPSVEHAAGELRHAGFSGVSARAGRLQHRYSVDSYIAFMTEFDEETLIAGLAPDVRGRLLSALRRRLSALSEDEMTLRFPIVFATGRRSG